MYAEDILLLNEANRDNSTGSDEEGKGHNSDGSDSETEVKKAAIYCIALPAGIHIDAM